MKSVFFATSFALAIAAVSAQGFSLSSIPKCAQECATTSIAGTSCSPTDISCICKSTEFASVFEPCVQKSTCSAADQQATFAAASDACGGSSSASASGSTTAAGSKTTTEPSGTASATTPTTSVTFDISKIPSCASTCALSAISSTDCNITDMGCVCKDSTFIMALSPCISASCSPADQQTMYGLASTLCSAYGVSISSILTASVTGMVTTAASDGTSTIHTGNSSSTTSTATRSSAPSTTLTESTTGPATTAAASASSTETGGAVKLAGSGFVAAAMGVMVFML